jgi:hypothetical protein
MTSIAVNFKNLAIGLAAVGLVLGAAFGAGIAYGRTGDNGSTATTPNFADLIAARGSTGAGTGGASGFQTVLGSMGAITAIDGDTITVETAQGAKQIHITDSTGVSMLEPASITELKVGNVIAFSGEARDDGSVDATAIDEVASQLESLSSGLPGGGGAFPGGNAPSGATGSSGAGSTGSGGAPGSGGVVGTPGAGGGTAPPTATLETAPIGSSTATPVPDRTSCDDIRGTEYRSATEREFFLQNCTSSE